MMRYPKGRKAQTRKRIVENASYGLRDKGTHGLSVPDLMKLAGLTHGGFYSHFQSRDELVAEAFAFAIDQTTERWADLMRGKTGKDQFDAIVADYLSPRHRDRPEFGCPLPTLAADVGRSNARARHNLERKLEGMIEAIAQALPETPPKKARQTATSVISIMVGSMILSRAVKEKSIADSILDAGRKAAQQLRA